MPYIQYKKSQQLSNNFRICHRNHDRWVLLIGSASQDKLPSALHVTATVVFPGDSCTIDRRETHDICAERTCLFFEIACNGDFRRSHETHRRNRYSCDFQV